MRYETNGDVTTVYDNKNRSFIIDTDQIEKAQKYNWYVDERKGYVISTSHKIKYKRLHRYLLDTDLVIDHINRNPSDNRLSNLRICTVSQNNLNRRVRCDSETGVKGVTYDDCKKKYRARIQLNGKRVSLGYFNTIAEAQAEYEKKYAELFL